MSVRSLSTTFVKTVWRFLHIDSRQIKKTAISYKKNHFFHWDAVLDIWNYLEISDFNRENKINKKWTRDLFKVNNMMLSPVWRLIDTVRHYCSMMTMTAWWRVCVCVRVRVCVACVSRVCVMCVCVCVSCVKKNFFFQFL